MTIRQGQWVKITQHPIYQDHEGRVISVDEYGDFAVVRLYDEDTRQVTEIDIPTGRLEVLREADAGEDS